MLNKLSRLFDLVIAISKLPVARLGFRREIDPDNVAKFYKYFTSRHPRYKIFQNKELGAALVDLAKFQNRAEYMQTITGRNSAEHHARRARAKGYRVVEIDKNDYVDAIHAINTSVEVRQGRPMDATYREKQQHYSTDKNFTYYGVVNAAGKLTGYADVGFFGDFAAFNRVIGMRNNDGAMHLLMVEIVSQMIEYRTVNYLMYDTYFGASPGLQTFKKMLGFEPYRAKYSIQ
jgi:hypothetical protein